MADNCCRPKPAHFQDKDALGHVAEAKAQGLLSSSEIHGAEIPGHLSAAADSAKEIALATLILWIILTKTGVSSQAIWEILAIFCLGWLIWKTGKSAWLGWSRLERMHRIVEQERWEIQHHRQQEREELGELYKAKGFEGKLLEDVLDVLMADEERLLRVMVDEELCLSLGTQEHPLKQASGALAGGLIATVICLTGLFFLSSWGIWATSFLTIGVAAAISATYERNRRIPAIVWNLGLAAVAASCIYFLLDYFRQ